LKSLTLTRTHHRRSLHNKPSSTSDTFIYPWTVTTMFISTYFTVLGLLLAGSTQAATIGKRRQCGPGGPNHNAGGGNVNLIASGSSTQRQTSTVKSTVTIGPSSAAANPIISTASVVTRPTTTTNVPKPSTSVAAPKPSTSSAAPAPAPPVSNPSGDGCGIGWNYDSGSKVNTLTGSGSHLSWYYGWNATPLPNMANLEFVPMVHKQADVAGIKAASAGWAAGTKYVLSFNEPDMKASVGGSDMSPSLAATEHINWVKNLGGSYIIGSPGVARGSKKWMTDWVAACGGKCKYDFVPFHWYGTKAEDMIKDAKDFYATFGKPLWLTEWSCKDYGTGYTCTDAEVKKFMSTSISFFRGEGKDMVHRWAYFGAFPSMANAEKNPNGLLAADGSANAMGKYYVSL